MGAAKVLVVDDEPGMVRLVTLYLHGAGYTVISETTGAGALQAVDHHRPDLVVLDVGLPDIDGYAVCRQVRAGVDIPIIMLTARGEPRDRVAGLEGGADDYISKPFQPDELVARVRAVLRRARPQKQRVEHYAIEGLTVDTVQRDVNLDGERIDLRPKEFDLLVELISHPGQVFTREQLVERVWGYEYLGDGATLDVHVWRLRGKLGETGKQARYIQTVWGVGYRLKAVSHGA
ncbi:MAG: response regulator transcription factor [Chloroflexota bacterium]|nr:MAG: DNA-binding response regulator [Chloroflexota bacterium]